MVHNKNKPICPNCEFVLTPDGGDLVCTSCNYSEPLPPLSWNKFYRKIHFPVRAMRVLKAAKKLGRFDKKLLYFYLKLPPTNVMRSFSAIVRSLEKIGLLQRTGDEFTITNKGLEFANKYKHKADPRNKLKHSVNDSYY